MPRFRLAQQFGLISGQAKGNNLVINLRGFEAKLYGLLFECIVEH